MPHQCLQCGRMVPEDASALLLQGCPDCKGTRFFYTRRKVADDERQEIADKAKKDLREVVTSMIEEAAPGSTSGLQGDGWKEIKARDLRRLVKQVQDQKGAPAGWENPDVEPVDGGAKERLDRVRTETETAREAHHKPETVEAGDGAYDIDVQGLLEKNPIVVHKDGAYMIHLPSLFDQRHE